MRQVVLPLMLALNAVALPSESRTPGGLAIFRLQERPLEVTLGERRALIVQDKDEFAALVGLDLTEESDIYINIKYPERNQKLNITLTECQYPIEHLHIAKTEAQPNPELLRRIQEEAKVVNSALSKYTNGVPDLDFVRPAKGRVSSKFGYKRIYNNLRESVHRGMDFAGPNGSPVVAASGGKVVLVGKFYLSGNTVVLDHGQGLYTIYCHLRNIAVRDGQRVAKGADLGSIGTTGVVTGAHLHFGVSLSGARVDPNLFLKS